VRRRRGCRASSYPSR